MKRNDTGIKLHTAGNLSPRITAEIWNTLQRTESYPDEFFTMTTLEDSLSLQATTSVYRTFPDLPSTCCLASQGWFYNWQYQMRRYEPDVVDIEILQPG